MAGFAADVVDASLDQPSTLGGSGKGAVSPRHPPATLPHTNPTSHPVHPTTPPQPPVGSGKGGGVQGLGREWG